jgi:hypothetical protein
LGGLLILAVPVALIFVAYRALHAAGETPMWTFPIAWAVLWSITAIGLPVLAVATRRTAWMSNRRIVVAGLLLVGGAAVSLWVAGFNHGMSIADTFLTSGGDAAASGPLIMALGTAAVIVAIFLEAPTRRAAVDRS